MICLHVEYMINYVWICVGGTSFHYMPSTQTNNSAGKVGKAILHLLNREHSYEFCGKELQSVAEKITSQTQLRLFQKVSIVQYLYMHHKPPLVLKATVK